MKIALTWLCRANKYTANVLPPAAAGVLAFLIVSYPVRRAGIWETMSELYANDYMPGWVPGVLILGILTLFAALLTYLTAHEHPRIANAATVAGLLLAMALAVWPAQQCTLTGGMVAGATVAGGIAVTATLIAVIRGKSPWTLPDVNEDIANIGKMRFIQIAIAIYMGMITLFTISSPITDAIPTESRGIILVFAGTGFVAASVISPKRRLKDYLAIAGAVVSGVGAYIQMDQGLASSGSANFRAVHLMIATGILACVPLMVIAGFTSKLVRIVGVSLLAACITMTAIFISALVSIFLLAWECNAIGGWVAHGVGITSIATFSAGISAFIIVALMLTFSPRKSDEETAVTDESE